MDELMKLLGAIATHPTTLSDAQGFAAAVKTVVEDVAKGEGGLDKAQRVLAALEAAAGAAGKVVTDLQASG